MGKLQLAGRMRDALRTLMPVGLNITHSYGEEFPPLERNGLTARCHRDWPQDAEFLDQWTELLKRNPWATVFRSPVWQTAVVDEFVPAGQFRLITVQRDQQLLALVPFALNTSAMLETPGRWVTDYLDPLVDYESTAECWTMILELLQDLWDWSLSGIYLPHVRGDSILRTLLPQICSRFGFNYEEEIFDQAPFIPLPSTWEGYLATLDSHERKEIKRKIRNAETKGAAKWLTITDAEQLNPALERAMEFMRQIDGEKGDFTDEVLIGFLRRLCPQLHQQGDFFMHELWIENRPVAWLLGLRSSRGPMMYNTAYDSTARNWSPGVVSFALAIRDAITAGHPIFNLLRGGEEYKKRLGAIDLDLLKITLRPR